MPRADIPHPIEDAIRRALRGIPSPWREAIADQMMRGRNRPRRGRNRPKRDRDPDHGGVPVDPNKPRGLQGGAAAALEFDD